MLCSIWVIIYQVCWYKMEWNISVELNNTSSFSTNVIWSCAGVHIVVVLLLIIIIIHAHEISFNKVFVDLFETSSGRSSWRVRPLVVVYRQELHPFSTTSTFPPPLPPLSPPPICPPNSPLPPHPHSIHTPHAPIHPHTRTVDIDTYIPHTDTQPRHITHTIDTLSHTHTHWYHTFIVDNECVYTTFYMYMHLYCNLKVKTIDSVKEKKRDRFLLCPLSWTTLIIKLSKIRLS